MEKMKPTPPGTTPITEADLHAYADHQLPSARRAEVAQFLRTRPDELRRVQDWQGQNESLRQLLNPVLEEPLPLRLPLQPEAIAWPWRGLAAGVAIAVVSASSAWFTRGSMDDRAVQLASRANPSLSAYKDGHLSGFARRAAVAHVVYSPDIRRPVEVGADQEQQLVTWLSKRLGTEVKPPSLNAVGYELIGGRLLPGDSGPVAQFMYHDGTGQRLTLYVTREVPRTAGPSETAFRFGKDGPVNVFYWVDKDFGYAISGGSDREELMRVSKEVYRQLGRG
ncbi:Transmembrane regulator protein PrtR [Polaromonas sp. CG9_12]|nr:Transmembrane regulator protein PrtR [Polaromonas sp. CG9_12]